MSLAIAHETIDRNSRKFRGLETLLGSNGIKFFDENVG
jgi:hypothetical protein